MAAPKERPPEHSPSGGGEGTCRLRMRVAPEAVIIVTKQNRIVLVDSLSWNMEDFNRREVVEILVPAGFQGINPAGGPSSPGAGGLPVELVIAGGGAFQHAGSIARESQVPPETKGTESRLEYWLARGAEDSILATTQDGAIRSWNAGARKLYGYAEEEILGRPVSVLIPYEHRSGEERFRDKVLGGESIPPYDSARIRKDQTVVAVSVALSLIQDEGGSILGVSEIAREISGRQKVENDLSAQVETLTQSNRELQDYAMVVAHDLQAPLNLVMRYFSELSRRCGNLIDSETTELLTKAADAVPRMQRLIKELLELARLDGRTLNRTDADCSLVAAQALSNLELLIKESRASVTVDPLPTLSVDPTQFSQVIQNLVANAIKFRGEHAPEIHIGAEKRPGEWRFHVTDNGIGIDPAMIPRLFQPLQRLNAGGHYPGSGLGLAIARKIMTRHGGRIWVESVPGSGSTFYFTIPCTDSNDPVKPA